MNRSVYCPPLPLSSLLAILLGIQYNIAMRVVTKSARETVKLGLKLAKKIHGGQILALRGGLGTGKTYFTKGFARGLGIKRIVTSPSFLFLRVHPVERKGIKYFCHVDAYRLKKPVEMVEIGLKEYLGRRDSVVVVEWADKIKKLLAAYPALILTFSFLDKNMRSISITKGRLGK